MDMFRTVSLPDKSGSKSRLYCTDGLRLTLRAKNNGWVGPTMTTIQREIRVNFEEQDGGERDAKARTDINLKAQHPDVSIRSFRHTAPGSIMPLQERCKPYQLYGSLFNISVFCGCSGDIACCSFFAIERVRRCFKRCLFLDLIAIINRSDMIVTIKLSNRALVWCSARFMSLGSGSSGKESSS